MAFIPLVVIIFPASLGMAGSQFKHIFPEPPISFYETSAFLGETVLGDGCSLPDTPSFVGRRMYLPNVAIGIYIRRLPFRHGKPDIEGSSW